MYYGQRDKDIKSRLTEDVTFKGANKDKDPIKLYKILQNANFGNKSSQEPNLTLCAPECSGVL